MKRIFSFAWILLILVGLALALTACDTYDVDKNGVPQFMEADYIDLSRITQISKFRSAAGHDFSDSFEACRSMKHYFWPAGGNPGEEHDPSWTTIEIYSPCDGTISLGSKEWAGYQVWIDSEEYPAFQIRIFHVTLDNLLKSGDEVIAGQLIGHHASDMTMSDIAVQVMTPSGLKFVSYFEALTDDVFLRYQESGIDSRQDMIISKEARDQDPLTCQGEEFIDTGSLDDFVTLE